MKNVTEQVAHVRFTPYRDYPMDVTLRIYSRSSKRWRMAIKALGRNWDEIFVDITPKYLKELNAMLREAAGKLLHHAGLGDKFDDEEQLQTDLVDLAKAGNFVFNEIFDQQEAKDTIQGLFRYAEKSGKSIMFEIEAEDFFIPWELLYSDSLEDPRYENFWGMKYIISRIIIQRKTPGNVESPTISVDSKPKLGLLALTSKSLPSIESKEIPFFVGLDKKGKISLQRLPGLDPTPTQKESELSRFKQFLNTPLDVAHFACHAHYDAKKSVESFIQLSNGIRISLRDLKEEPTVAIKDFPLVVLNACNTGPMDPLDVRYFAGDFIKYGALGVIATETAVPDDLAAEFTQHLYDHLLDEKFLGESVMLARQELLAKGNPVGLLYALYATPIIKLELPKAKKSRAGNRKRNAISIA